MEHGPATDHGDVDVTGLAHHVDGSLVLSGSDDGALQFAGVVRGRALAGWVMVLNAVPSLKGGEFAGRRQRGPVLVRRANSLALQRRLG